MTVGQLTATLTMNDAGFTAAIARARSAFTGLAGQASSAGQQVGSNFSQGIASGISAGTGAIQAAAAAAASAARSAAEAALQIHSPSRVGIDIGSNFGLGLSVGIDRMVDTVMKSARAASGIAALQSRASLSAPPPSAPQSLTQQPSPADRPTILMINGRELARTTVDDTNHALGTRIRQLNVGYGG